jgi:DNA-binding CsgD family transcriptional regulator
MRGVSARDVAAVLAVVRELAEVSDQGQLVEEALGRLLSVIGGDVSGYNYFHVPTYRVSVQLRPAEPLYVQLAEHLPDTIDDHPVLRHVTSTCDPRPCRVSDLVSPREWRATTIYAEILGPMRTPHLLAIPMAVGKWGGEGYVITRGGRDFTDRERDVADVVQAALVALHHRPRLASSPTVFLERPGRGGGGPLTPREVEVLRLVALGCTAQAVSSTLRISPRTVRKHLEHVYEKLEVHDRLLAVDRARDLGLLQESGQR